MRITRSIFVCASFLLNLICGSAWCEPPEHRPKIGVALEGGGAKGLADIDVLRWLEEHHIPVDYIAGTSMGGLVAGLYATGYSPAEMQQIITHLDWNELLAGTIPFSDMSFRRKEDLRAFPNGVEIGLRHGPELPGGLNSGQSVQMVIDRYMLPYSDIQNFDALPTPFRCVATDLVSGKAMVFKDGSLRKALRATMALPAVFSPVPDGGHIYTDGGLLDNLPTDVVKEMGADVVIGVHLSEATASPQNLNSMLQVTGGSIDVMINANVLRGMQLADVLVSVDVSRYSTLGFTRADEIIRQGYEAAQAKANVLSAFSLPDAEWNRYLAERNARKINSLPMPKFVDVEGTSSSAASGIENRMSPLVNKPIDTEALTRQITREMGVGLFNSMSYGLTSREGEDGLQITAEEKEYLPPWLKPGFEIDGSNPGNILFDFGGRITFVGIGGQRSEIRTDFSFGSTYAASAEYYDPLTSATRWFIAPQVGASKQPLNIYYKQNFIAEYKLNNVEGQFELGYNFDRFSQLQFGYQAGYLSSTRFIGAPDLPTVSGRTGFSGGTYVLDRLDQPIIPRQGIGLTLNAGWHDAYPGARNPFPSAEASFEIFQSVRDPDSIYFQAQGGSTFGARNTGIPQFALGGGTRLAAYGVNQFLTDQYVYGRIGYLHRIAYLPTFLGNGIYFDAHIEAAKPYYLPDVNIPADATADLILKTTFGPLLIGASAGEGGNHTWFFQLGRIF